MGGRVGGNEVGALVGGTGALLGASVMVCSVGGGVGDAVGRSRSIPEGPPIMSLGRSLGPMVATGCNVVGCVVGGSVGVTTGAFVGGGVGAGVATGGQATQHAVSITRRCASHISGIIGSASCWSCTHVIRLQSTHSIVED